jgi:hypothetical protein
MDGLIMFSTVAEIILSWYKRSTSITYLQLLLVMSKSRDEMKPGKLFGGNHIFGSLVETWKLKKCIFGHLIAC